MSNPLLVFVGSYAVPEGSGVYSYSFNEDTAELERLDEVAGLRNPTFLHVDAPAGKLYSINEIQSAQGGKQAEAICYAIEASGKITELNRSVALDAPTCHIQKSGDRLVLTSYHGGNIALVALQADGTVGATLDVAQHEGSGPHERQDKPHPHSAFFSPDQRFVFISDLGIDQIKAYEVKEGKLHLHGSTSTEPGAGPRHLVFHPNGQYVYVIHELSSTVGAYHYDAELGTLQHFQTISTLPADFTVENTCAEITISADGRYLYGSNRGHDSIVVYEIDSATGQLSFIQFVSTEGKHPRHFSLTPSGKHLIVANRDTDNITTFNVDLATGLLTYTGKSVEVSQPVCIRPVSI